MDHLLQRLCAMLLCGLLLHASGHAQTVQRSQAPESLDRPFTAVVVGSNPEGLAYGDPVVFSVRVSGVKQKTEFSDFEALALGEISDLYRAGKDPDAQTCKLNGPSTIEPGGEVVATCQLYATEGMRFWRPAAWWLIPKQQRISVKIPVVGKDANTTLYYHEISMHFKASLDAVLVGGLFGAFLLALFGAVKERAYVKYERYEFAKLRSTSLIFWGLLSWLANLPVKLWVIVLQTLMGGICALILILLAQSTDGLNPPVSIKVQDFWGGVVIGLFSIPLSKWIWNQVRPRDDAEASGNSTAPVKSG